MGKKDKGKEGHAHRAPAAEAKQVANGPVEPSKAEEARQQSLEYLKRVEAVRPGQR